MSEMDLFKEKGEAAIGTMDNPVAIALTRICLEYIDSEYGLEAKAIGKLALILEPHDAIVTCITDIALTEIGVGFLGFGKGEN
jgi:hypothetical protein